MTNIKIARNRLTGYTVTSDVTGSPKTYNWVGIRGDRVDTKAIPLEVVDFLTMNSNCFRDGELTVIEDSEEAKEIVENIPDIDDYKTNSITKEEIKAILEGNTNKMKAELNKLENKDTKKFVIDVAKEIKLDSNTKLTFLAEWFGVAKDLLFD